MLTDKVQKINYHNDSFGGDLTYYLLPKVDQENSKIYLEMILNPYHYYYYLDIDYDFTNKAVTSYHLGVYKGSNNYQNQSIDADGKVYCAKSEDNNISDEFKNELDTLYNAYEAKIESAITVDGDFTSELDDYNTKSSAIFMSYMRN